MKKLFKSGLLLLMGLFISTGIKAQEMPQNPVMPVDAAVRVGVLPNGLTYYIRHNETPKGQADFYIAQKVGSALEEDNQRGLAHFLEHMCFNGTEHFPGSSLRDWLETKGVKFGYDLNAYTSIDETVYNISSVPVADKNVQDSCLLILHDWACALTLDPAEIDSERGVIHEEWRRAMAGQMRILENLLPVIYPNNRYGYRLPIGTMDVVDNFPPQAIVDYYHTWYRPDQQGIIVVGDIDPDYIEAKIKELFEPIKMPENAKERTYIPVEDTPGTIYAIGNDPEMNNVTATIAFKFDNFLPREMRNTAAFYSIEYLTDIISSMLNSRLRDMTQDPNCPFAYASVGIGEYMVSKTKSAVDLSVYAKDGNIVPALAAAYRELLRAVRGGFTQTEFDRANAELKSQYQKLYDNRNQTKNESYSREYVRAFIDNNPIPGIEIDKQMFDMLAMAVPVDQVNTLLPELVQNDNRVVLVMMPDAEGYTLPTEDNIAAALAAVDAEEIEPYAEEVRTDPIIPALPAPGKIASERKLEQWDATEFTLSNGVKVIVKPTTFKENEIVFNAFAKGGYSEAKGISPESIIFLPYAISKTGFGTYTSSDVSKYLKGKQVDASFGFDSDTREINGSSTKEDLATLMELIYAGFTEFNLDEKEFAGMQAQMTGMLANSASDPQFVFQQLLYKTLYKSPAAQMLTPAVVEAANRDQILELVHSSLANASDYTFVFTGNIDLDTFKPLLKQYIATLPANGTESQLVFNPDFEVARGSKVTTDSMTMTTPQVWTFYSFAAEMPYSAKNRNIISIIGQIMTNRLLAKVREEMGATYSIGASGSLNRTSKFNTLCQIFVPLRPELAEQVFTEIEAIANNMATDITADELNTIKASMVKNATAALEKNETWNGAIAAWTLNGVDTFTNTVEVLNDITLDDVLNFWKEVLAQKNTQHIILNPIVAE